MKAKLKKWVFAIQGWGMEPVFQIKDLWFRKGDILWYSVFALFCVIWASLMYEFATQYVVFENYVSYIVVGWMWVTIVVERITVCLKHILKQLAFNVDLLDK